MFCFCYSWFARKKLMRKIKYHPYINTNHHQCFSKQIDSYIHRQTGPPVEVPPVLKKQVLPDTGNIIRFVNSVN